MSKPPRRGRPRKFDEDAALDKIIEVFHIHGYAGTSLDMLKDASGLNRPSLYGAFGDKWEIFLMAQQRYNEKVADRLNKALNEDETLEDCLRAFFKTAIEIYTDNGGRGCFTYSVGILETPSQPEIVTQIDKVTCTAEQEIFERLALSVEKGEIEKTADLQAVSKLILTLLNGLSVRSRAQTKPEDLIAISEFGVQAVLQTIGLRPFSNDI